MDKFITLTLLGVLPMLFLLTLFGNELSRGTRAGIWLIMLVVVLMSASVGYFEP